jgi:hypothetical protein
MQRTFSMPFYVPGTLSADVTFDFKLPMDVQLVHVSALVATNNAGILVGTSSTANAYVDATDGAITAGTVLEINRTGFVGDQFPHIPKGTQIRVTADDTGADGTEWFAVLTFTEG